MLEKQRFVSLQRRLHPDSHAAEEDEANASDWSSYLNSCHDLIKDPLKRAIFLVSIGFILRFLLMF